MMAAKQAMARLTLIPQGITVVLAGFLPIFAIICMFPAVPSIIGHFSSDPDAGWLVPLMVSAPGLSIAVLAPFAGFFIDRFGRRKLILYATLFYGFTGAIPLLLDSLRLMFVSRLALGVCEAAIITVLNTLIGDYWKDTGRRDWLFLQGFAGPIAGSAAVMISGLITAIWWKGAFLVYLIALPIFGAMVVYLFEPSTRTPESHGLAATGESRTFPWVSAAAFGSVTMFTSTLYYVYVINGGMAFKEVGIEDPARLSALAALPVLAVMIGAAIFRLLAARSSATQFCVLFLVLGGGLMGIGLAPDYRTMVGLLVIQQIGAGIAVPTLIAWTHTQLPFAHRGRGMGIWTACFFLGQFLSPWMVHKLQIGTGSMQGAFLAAGTAGVAAGVIALGRGLLRIGPSKIPLP